MKPDYEVIVVGAGPAGATLAYELASRGIRVLVLEKESLPRYKCCAGGITIRLANLLDYDIHEIVEDTIYGAIVTYKGNEYYRGRYDQPVIYTVRRDKFDYALTKRAEEAGATIVQECPVLEVRFNNGGVEVSTSVGDFRSQFVAGADGAGSVVAKALGLRDYANNAVAVQSEVMVSEEEMTKWKGHIGIDLGRISGGYGWVFPKSDHLSIGFAFLHSRAKEIKHHYQEFLDSLNLGNYTVARRDSGLIPLCRSEVVASRGRAVLLGDAAGLVDPLTGEGIYHAILSAKLSAPVIQNALLNGEEKLAAYQKAVEDRIMPEIKIARSLSRFLTKFPNLIFKTIGRDSRIWRGACYLLRGELNYTAAKQRMGALGGLYSFITQHL